MPRKKRRMSELGPSVAPATEAPITDDSAAEQSGDLQGLPTAAGADSQSVRELVEDGQFYEAAVVSGVEEAGDAGTGEVKTRQMPMDDTPPEYTDRDPDDPME